MGKFYTDSRSMSVLKVRPFTPKNKIQIETSRNSFLREAAVSECEIIKNNSRLVEGSDDHITLKLNSSTSVDSRSCTKDTQIQRNVEKEGHKRVKVSEKGVIVDSPTSQKFSDLKLKEDVLTQLLIGVEKPKSIHISQDTGLEKVESILASCNVPFYLPSKKENNNLQVSRCRPRSKLDYSGKSNAATTKKKNALRGARSRMPRSRAEIYAYHIKRGKITLVGKKRKLRLKDDDNMRQSKKQMSSIESLESGNKGKSSVSAMVSFPFLSTLLEVKVNVET